MCPEHELLSAFLDGEVDEPWKSEIDKHLAGCPHCRQRISAYQNLSRLLKIDPQPDYRLSMKRLKKLIQSGPGIINIKKTPFWKKRLQIPVPVAAAAASLFIILGTLFSVNLAIPGGLAGNNPEETVAEIDTLPADDLETIMKLIENKNTNNEVIIKLPDNSRFFVSGEPQFIRAKDLNRSK
jgi:negative regulator of sigma E activity